MRACDRFEREGLLLLEQGLPLDAHFDECPDCRRARAEYERLGVALAGAGADAVPSPHWQARVWSRIERRRSASSRRKWFLWLAPAAAVAAAVVAVVWLGPAAREVRLDVALEAGPGVQRGVEAQPGDRLRLRAATAGAAFAELRIYRGDTELILRCSDKPPCVRQGDTLRAEMALPSVGSYQPLLLISEESLAPPTGSGLDADADAALKAGARLRMGREIRVR